MQLASWQLNEQSIKGARKHLITWVIYAKNPAAIIGKTGKTGEKCVRLPKHREQNLIFKGNSIQFWETFTILIFRSEDIDQIGKLLL